MKKLILTTVFTSISLACFAQESISLNVKLSPIQTLVVNSNQKIVDLIYSNKSDYANGVTTQNDNHLTIYSTGGFQVQVKSNTITLNNSIQAATENSINANSISIIPSAGTDGLSEAVYSQKLLSTKDQTIVSSRVGGVDKKISVAYKGAGADAYVNNYIAGQNPTIFSTTVMYTIIAQ